MTRMQKVDPEVSIFKRYVCGNFKDKHLPLKLENVTSVLRASKRNAGTSYEATEKKCDNN